MGERHDAAGSRIVPARWRFPVKHQSPDGISAISSSSNRAKTAGATSGRKAGEWPFDLPLADAWPFLLPLPDACPFVGFFSNCSASVDPANAHVELCPEEITVATAS